LLLRQRHAGPIGYHRVVKENAVAAISPEEHCRNLVRNVERTWRQLPISGSLRVRLIPQQAKLLRYQGAKVLRSESSALMNDVLDGALKEAAKYRLATVLVID
jgi:hypothetical protein